MQTDVEPITQAECDGKRWFRRPWVKILTFIVFLPLWAVIIWTDPAEKRRMKIFAAVMLALGIGAEMAMYYDPLAVAEREMSLKWGTATPLERQRMLSHTLNFRTLAFGYLDDCGREKIVGLLGKPDITRNREFVYFVEDTNHVATNTTLSIHFNKNDKYDGMSLTVQPSRPRVEIIVARIDLPEGAILKRTDLAVMVVNEGDEGTPVYLKDADRIIGKKTLIPLKAEQRLHWDDIRGRAETDR